MWGFFTNDDSSIFATISEGLAVGSYDDEGDVWSRVATSGVGKAGHLGP
jgi:hypothetical protein